MVSVSVNEEKSILKKIRAEQVHLRCSCAGNSGDRVSRLIRTLCYQHTFLFPKKKKKNFLGGPVPYPHVSSQTSHQQTGNNGVNRNNAEQQLLDIEGKKERDESLMLQKQQKADALPALPIILQKQPLCSRRAFQLF